MLFKEDPIWSFDQTHHKSMFRMLESINGRHEDVVGWYSTCPEPHVNNLDMHAVFRELVSNLNHSLCFVDLSEEASLFFISAGMFKIHCSSLLTSCVQKLPHRKFPQWLTLQWRTRSMRWEAASKPSSLSLHKLLFLRRSVPQLGVPLSPRFGFCFFTILYFAL